MTQTHVVAAVLHKDGRILVCKRAKNKRYGGLWEFPGGKVEQGESPATALVREMKEELNIDVAIDGLYHVANDDDLLLTFLCCHQVGGDLALHEHQAYAYVAADQLCQYAFCPADQEAVGMLQKTPRFARYN